MALLILIVSFKIFSCSVFRFCLLSLICSGFLYHGQFFFILELLLVVLLATLVWVDRCVCVFFFRIWNALLQSLVFESFCWEVSCFSDVFPLYETFSPSILFLLLFSHILNVLIVICCGEFLFLPWIPGVCVLLYLYGYVFP